MHQSLCPHDARVMASQKLPNCCVGVCAYLRCILRHCGVPYVRRIPQDLRALHLGLFAEPSSLRTFCGTIKGNASRIFAVPEAAGHGRADVKKTLCAQTKIIQNLQKND
jgi:hypothetical protein